jgi:plastocyanin
MTTISNTAGTFNKMGGSILRAIFICVLLMSLTNTGSALTYYSKTSGDWNSPDTWWTEGDGSFQNKGTYPRSADKVVIMNGHVVTIVSNEACGSLDLGMGKSGMLQFGNGSNYTLYIFGTLNISAGGVFQYVANSGRQHNVTIQGDFNNNGSVKFCKDNDDYVSLTFVGPGNSIISGKGAWDNLAFMTVNKSSRSDIVRTDAKGFGKALTKGASTLTFPYELGLNPPVIFQRGTFVYNCPDNLSNLIDPGNGINAILTVNPEVAIQVKQGVLDIATYPDIKTTGYCLLKGQLLVDGGKVTISKNVKTTGMLGLFYSNSPYTTAKVSITNGEIISAGSFAPETPNFDEIEFAMTGGKLMVNTGSVANPFETFWITNRAGSSVDFTGGTIIINKKSTYASAVNNADFDMGGANMKRFNVSGNATVQFGSNATPESQTILFAAYPGVVYPHIVVQNPGKGRTITVKPFNNADYSFLSLYVEERQVFENQDALTSSEFHVMTITSSKDMFSIYNDGTMKFAKGTIKFSGNSNQEIGGLALDPY